MEFLIAVNDAGFLFDNRTEDTYRTDAMYNALYVVGKLVRQPYLFGYTEKELEKIDVEKRNEEGETVWVRTIYLKEDEE